MFRRIFTFLTSTLLLVGNIIAQLEPVARYKMDDCSFGDTQSGFDALFFGGNACACGVQANGVVFDGNLNFVEFPDQISTLFEQNFSLTFYVQFDAQSNEPVDLFYYGANCGSDSLFSVRYLPNINQLRVRLSDAPTNEVQIQGDLSTETCWQYIAITKNRSVISLYVNGRLLDQGSATSDLSVKLFESANLTISNSPCQNVAINADRPFKGLIDELVFYNYALSEREVNDLNLKPDQIITNDTTIFAGETIQILTGGTCASQFSWDPTDGFADPNALDPVITPSSSAVYTLTTEGNSCTVTDQIRVSVLDRENITCEDLLLPSGFTPNNDRINDRLSISNQYLIEQLNSFEVFDKWGGRLFYTNSLSDSWDGSFRNIQSSPGAYVYKVNYSCQGEEYTKTGVVNLIR